MLANELGRRNISVLLIDEKSSTAFNPQANATQARTMEHFRRLGFADEVRVLGLPADYPTDIAYFTRYAGYELARFSLPSSGVAKISSPEPDRILECRGTAPQSLPEMGGEGAVRARPRLRGAIQFASTTACSILNNSRTVSVRR